MNRFAKTFNFSACALAASVLISACGGGDAGVPFASTATIGYAVDGYLKDASVKCDASGVVVKTDSAGFFRFPDGCSSSVSLTGGTNVDTLLPFTGTLKAPAGSKMVTPLTTLLVGGMTQEQVNASLGLPEGTDLTNTDPALTSAGALVNADLLKKTLALQQLIMQTTDAMAAFAGDSSDATRQAIYSEVASAFAAGLTGGAKLNSTSTTVDLAVLQTLVTDAGTRLATSTSVPAAVKSAISLVRADTFAAVISGGLKAQAEVLLGMANADVTTVTAAQQSDTKIKSAVTATGMSAILMLPPSDAAVVAKATALTDAITGGGEVVEPPNTGVGTVLISWDEDPLPATGIGAFGDASPSVVAGPTGGSGNALKLDRSGTQNFGGTYFNVPVVPFTADRKIITARVQATRPGAVVYLKVEVPGGAATEVAATVTAANTWETLTWDLSAINVANSYTVMVFSADTDVAVGGAQTYWIEDITLAEASSSGGGGGTAASSLISWDEDPLPATGIGAFGDASPSVVAGPTGGSGNALKLDRSGTQNFGGTYFNVPVVPFTADRKIITARVQATRPGAVVYLKVEVPGGAATEVAATVTAANTWETLTWDLSAINAANSYTVMVFSADTDVAIGGAQTYWIDDIQLEAAATGGGGTATSTLPITFDNSAVTYTLTGFEGAQDSTLVNDPAGGSNKVVKVVKAAGAPWYAGTTVSTGANNSIAIIPFTNSAKTMTTRVYSPGPGMRVRLKVENASNPGITCETDAVTVGTGWETLTFNFANPGLAPPVTGGPTAALNVAETYNKVSVFMSVATEAVGQAGTFYFDDLAFGN